MEETAIAQETAKNIIQYCKDTLRIDENKKRYIQQQVYLSGTGGALEQFPSESLNWELTIAATLVKIISDEDFISKTEIILGKLNVIAQDLELQEGLKSSKEVLTVVKDTFSLVNEKYFKDNLSTEDIIFYHHLLQLINGYLDPFRLAYFQLAHLVTLNMLTQTAYFFVRKFNDPRSLELSTELNTLGMQILLEFQQGRNLREQMLIRKLPNEILLQIRSYQVSSEHQYLVDAAQWEVDIELYLKNRSSLTPRLFNFIKNNYLGMKVEMQKNAKLEVANIFDRIHTSTDISKVLVGLYENNLSSELIPVKHPSTLGFLVRSFDQGGVLEIVQNKLNDEFIKAANPLFEGIARKSTNTKMSLFIALLIINGKLENRDILFKGISLKELFFEIPEVHLELLYFSQHNSVLNEEYIKHLLRQEHYNVLNEESVLYNELIKLLRKRAFLEVSYALFLVLRFPINIPREMGIGIIDACNVLRHPATNLYEISRWILSHPGQAAFVLWNWPTRTLTSISLLVGAVCTGFKIFSKLLKSANIVSNVKQFPDLISEAPTKLLTGGIPILETPATVSLLEKVSLSSIDAMRSVSLNDSIYTYKELLGNSRNNSERILPATDRPLTMKSPAFFKNNDRVEAEKDKNDETLNIILNKKGEEKSYIGGNFSITSNRI